MRLGLLVGSVPFRDSQIYCFSDYCHSSDLWSLECLEKQGVWSLGSFLDGSFSSLYTPFLPISPCGDLAGLSVFYLSLVAEEPTSAGERAVVSIPG